MRGAILGSGLVHLLLIGALAWVRTASTIILPGPETIQVALVEPPGMAPAPRPKPEPPPEKPRPAEVKPAEDTGVKLQPDARKKKAPEPVQEPAPPSPQRPVLASARVGAAGLKGDVSVDAGDFEFTYYLVLVRNRIAANWSPPAGMVSAGRPIRAVVYFRVARDGALTAVRLEETSGMEFFDRSTVRAVMLSDPLPPLPLGYTAPQLGIHFGFDWEAP